MTTRLLKAGAPYNPQGAKLFPKLLGIRGPVNFNADMEADNVRLSWEDNPGNDSVATGFTLTRAGQADVVLSGATLNYLDARAIVPGASIVWGVYLANSEGESSQTYTNIRVPGAAEDLITESGDNIVSESSDQLVTEAA